MNIFGFVVKKVIIYTAVILFLVPLLIFIALGVSSHNKYVRQNGNAQLSPSPLATPKPVPLPSKEDIVRTFCNLIDEGRISDAVGMVEVKNDSEAQAWGVNFNSLSSFKLASIKKSSIDDSGNSFEVDINVAVKDGKESYGWVNGINKRWINLVEDGQGRYKIAEIATGP